MKAGMIGMYMFNLRGVGAFSEAAILKITSLKLCLCDGKILTYVRMVS